MSNTYSELNTPKRILMGPGPSNVHPRVLKAMATPLVGHLDPTFLEQIHDVSEMNVVRIEASVNCCLQNLKEDARTFGISGDEER